MAQETIQLQIPFQVLVDFAAGLSQQDKRRLWEWLGEQIGQVEELDWEKDPNIQAEIHDARTAYEVGDYITLDEYLNQQQDNN